MRRLAFHRRALPTLAALAALMVTHGAAFADPGEWPQWRGPGRDGVSSEKGLLETWTDDGPRLLSRTDGLGRGYASVAIADDTIVTLGKRDGGAELIALDLEGEVRWAAPVGGGNPNSTPTIDGDLVYGLGRDGDLVCAKLADGEVVWRKDFSEDFGGKMMSGWGYSESPLVDGDKLVVTPGGNDAVIVALDKKTGETIWKAKLPDDIGRRGKDGAGYSSIVVSEAAGVRQYVQLVGRGVISVAAKDGRFLWGYNRIANDTANIPTPIVTGDKVFCSTGYGTGAALLELSSDGDGGVEAEEKYFLESRDLQNHHGGMILVGDYVYCGHGHNRGLPVCIRLADGEVVWKADERPGSGSAAILFADGRLYFRYEDGNMALIDATPDGYRLRGAFRLASRNDKSWPHPVIVDGKLYLRDQHELLIYEVAASKK